MDMERHAKALAGGITAGLAPFAVVSVLNFGVSLTSIPVLVLCILSALIVAVVVWITPNKVEGYNAMDAADSLFDAGRRLASEGADDD